MKKIDTILQFIESEAMNPAQFEKRAGWSNAYLKQTSERGVDITNKMLGKFLKEDPELYYRVFPKERDKILDELNKNQETIWLFSSVNLLLDEVAKLQSKVYGRDLLDCVHELEQNLKLLEKKMTNKS